MTVKPPDLTATSTANAMLGLFAPLPARAARSVTLDNGAENTQAWQLDTLAMPVYYADPYSAWQRGSNEHFNGVLRRYLAKGTSLNDLTETELSDITTEINNRPLKTLGWATPAETFQQLCSNQHHTIALQN